MKIIKPLLFFVIMGVELNVYGMDGKKIEDNQKHQITEFSLDSIISKDENKPSSGNPLTSLLKNDLSNEEQLKLYGFNLQHLKQKPQGTVRSMIPMGNGGMNLEMNGEMNSMPGNQIFIPVMQAVNNNLTQGLEDAQKNIQQNMEQQVSSLLDKKVGNQRFSGWVGQTIGTVTSSGTSLCGSIATSVASVITLVGCYAAFKYLGGS